MRYQAGSIAVDDTFARFGDKSYAIDKINSVETRTSAPHSKGASQLLWIVAGLSLLAGPYLLPFVALFGFLGYWQWKRSKIRIHRLFLMTSSGEAQALETRDHLEIAELRGAIEGAMATRSVR